MRGDVITGKLNDIVIGAAFFLRKILDTDASG